MSTIYYESNNTLYHHGIKGQKWGYRRFQNKDGSWTAAGEKRYGEGEVGSARLKYDKAKEFRIKAAKNYNRQTGGYGKHNTKSYKNYLDASRKEKWAKEDVSSAKVREKLKTHKVGKHEASLRDKYKQQGMSEEEASIAAYKRVRTERIIAASAAVTVAAAGAYAYSKYRRDNIDSVIKAGTKLQNVDAHGSGKLKDTFYSANSRMDKTKYRGMYGAQLKGSHGADSDIYANKIHVDKDIKLASQKSATQILEKTMKTNPEFKKDAMKVLSDSQNAFGTPRQNALVNKALASLKSGQVDKNVYEAMNLTLTIHSTPETQRTQKVFYDALKKQGYGAIRDINDYKYSGYKTKTANIVFDAANKAHIEEVKKLTDESIASDFNKSALSLVGSKATKTGAAFAAIYKGASVISNHNIHKNDSAEVAQYRKDHPGTKMSYTEITRMLEDKRR